MVRQSALNTTARCLCLFMIFMVGSFLIPETQAQSGYVHAGLQIDEGNIVESLKREYISYNHNTDKVDGWRLLIYSTSDRRQMNAFLKKFERKFNYVPHDWNYESPYYKLKAGAYLSRLEAMQAAEKFKNEFSGIIEIQDKIEKDIFLKK